MKTTVGFNLTEIMGSFSVKNGYVADVNTSEERVEIINFF